MTQEQPKINCSKITVLLNEILTKKVEFDELRNTDIPKALILKKEIELLIKKLKEILKPVFFIEGKEFPVFQLEIGGKTAEELENKLLSKKFKFYDYAKDMLHSSNFVTSLTVEHIDLVRLKVSDLGFPNGATTDEIYAKAQELGLELCPAEVGPHQRLKDADQSLDDYYKIAMKQITGPDGSPSVFSLDPHDGGLWLSYDIAKPDFKWHIGNEFMFRLPPFDSSQGKQVSKKD